jgi:hypothetical protein
MMEATTEVGKDEGGGNDNEGRSQQRGWGQHGDGNGEKDGRQVMAMATKSAVAMVTRMVGKDEGDGESGKSDGDGNKEGTCKE